MNTSTVVCFIVNVLFYYSILLRLNCRQLSTEPLRVGIGGSLLSRNIAHPSQEMNRHQLGHQEGPSAGVKISPLA